MTPYAPKQRQRVLDALLELHLFEYHDDGHYTVHNFLKWNRSRAEREELAERGRRGGLAKAKATAKPGPQPTPSPGSSPGYTNGHSPGQSPGSSTPRLASPTSENVNTNAELRSAVLECFAYWQERCEHPQAQLDDKRRRNIEGRLKDRRRHHSGDLQRAALDVRQAIDGAAIGAYVDDRGKRHDDIELICRNVAKLEDFMGRSSLPTGGQVVPMRKPNASDLLRALDGGAA